MRGKKHRNNTSLFNPFLCTEIHSTHYWTERSEGETARLGDGGSRKGAYETLEVVNAMGWECDPGILGERTWITLEARRVKKGVLSGCVGNVGLLAQLFCF